MFCKKKKDLEEVITALENSRLLEKNIGTVSLTTDLSKVRTETRPSTGSVVVELLLPCSKVHSNLPVYVAGDWNSWRENSTVCVKEYRENQYCYAARVNVQPGATYNFKFISGHDWISSPFYNVSKDDKSNNYITIPFKGPLPIVVKPLPIVYAYATQDASFALPVLFSSFEKRSLTTSTVTDLSFVLLLEFTRQTVPRIEESLKFLPKVTNTVVAIVLSSPNAMLSEKDLISYFKKKGAKEVVVHVGFYEAKNEQNREQNSMVNVLKDPEILVGFISSHLK